VGYAAEKPRPAGKRSASSLKGTDRGDDIRPSQGAMQYGDTDEFGPAYCTAFVEDEECRILVDTGSSVTLISATFFDKIKEKLYGRIYLTTNVRYRIQGVTGKPERPLAEVQNIPLQFDQRSGVWNLNAGVMEGAPADIILGTNFMIENNAIIDLKNQQIALRNEKTEQLVVLPLSQ